MDALRGYTFRISATNKETNKRERGTVTVRASSEGNARMLIPTETPRTYCAVRVLRLEAVDGVPQS